MNTLRYYIDLITESELVEPKVTTQQVQNLNREKLERFRSKRRRSDDSGYFSYPSELDPHQIKLSTYHPTYTENDPKFQYINAIKPLMGINPYVPNVYEIKMVQAKNYPTGDVKTSYTLQKLLAYHQIPTLSLYKITKSLMKDLVDNNNNDAQDLIKRFNKLRSNYETIKREIIYTNIEDPVGKKYDPFNDPGIQDHILDFRGECVYLIVDYLSDLYDNRIISKDDNLNQIMSIIKKTATKRMFFDMKTDNIMFRSNPYGHQLVITDPLA